MQVDNYMARDLPKEPTVVSECAGCNEDIYAEEDIYDFGDVLIHDNSSCCQEYIVNNSLLRKAGE